VFYTTKYYQEPSDRVAQGAYANLNMSLSWQPDNSGFMVRVWGKNLTDKAVLTSLLATSLYETALYLPPRIIGADLSYKF
jgi:iron complex outermembrane receptor protein